jgi:hypothetical protein
LHDSRDVSYCMAYQLGVSYRRKLLLLARINVIAAPRVFRRARGKTMEKKWAFQILSGDGNAVLISLSPSLLLALHRIRRRGRVFVWLFAQLACAVWRQTRWRDLVGSGTECKSFVGGESKVGCSSKGLPPRPPGARRERGTVRSGFFVSRQICRFRLRTRRLRVRLL